MIATRLLLYLALATPFGLALFAMPNSHAAAAIGIRRWLGGAIALATAASCLWLVLVAAQMAGTPTWPVDEEALGIVLGSTGTGTAWIVRTAALAVAAGAACSARPAALRLCAGATGVALASLAWTGHGVIDDGTVGWLHLGADILHLLASGVWLGALLGLAALLTRPALRREEALRQAAYRALRGFGPIGTVVVGLLVLTGAVQGWLLIAGAGLPVLAVSLYVRLLAAKLALFMGMLALAAANRVRLTPALDAGIARGDTGPSLARLRASLLAETALAIGVFALVAWLGTLEPPHALL